jgi:hypothetical protein
VEVTIAPHVRQAHAFGEITGASQSARAALLDACRWLKAL